MAAKTVRVEHQFATLEQQHRAATLGMWLFLATEIMVFGAIFGAFLAYRAMYPTEFDMVSSHLNVGIGGINTIVLLTSSLTMALSVYAIQAGKMRMLYWCLSLTALLGAAFLVIKGIEYYVDYRERLMPLVAFPPAKWTAPEMAGKFEVKHAELALTFYYFMTLLHALHLTIGIALIIWLINGVARSAITPVRYIPVEVIGLYWHFVDVVWIFLLPLLYLIGTHRSLFYGN
jgi:cytochrome c oxidase subunit 3